METLTCSVMFWLSVILLVGFAVWMFGLYCGIRVEREVSCRVMDKLTTRYMTPEETLNILKVKSNLYDLYMEEWGRKERK